MAVAVLVALTATPAGAQTVVEQRLADLKPCSALKLTQNLAGVPLSIGIDEVKSVTVKQADIAVQGNRLSFTLDGGLACRTPDNAPLKGDASVDISARATIDLAGCTVDNLEILPKRFGGSLRQVLEKAWKPLILPKLRQDAHEALVKACTNFAAGR